MQSCGLTIDEESEVVYIGGKYCPVTQQEYQLLRALALHANTPVSRKQLLREAWGYSQDGATRTVDVHIQRLRKKIRPLMIETIFGRGYMLHLPPADPKEE